MTDENLLLLLILLPFLGSAVAAMLPANARNAEAWLSGTISVLAFAVAGFLYPAVAAGTVVRRNVRMAA